MDFIEWLQDALLDHPAKELRVLLFLYRNLPKAISFQTLADKLEITSDLLSKLKRKKYILETGAGFTLLSFWHPVINDFESWTPPEIPTQNTDKILVNKLFLSWVESFNPELPTPNMYAINKSHAKRLLKNRDLPYWENVISLAKQDAFWSNSCRTSLSTLEKAAVQLVNKQNNKDLSDFFEKK